MSDITLDHGHGAEAHPSEKRIDNLKFAMWLYLGSETVIFMILIAAYVVFRVNHHDLVLEAREHVSITLVGINTFILLMSSWALVRGLFEIQQGNRAGLIRWMTLVAVLGFVFVGGQYIEYSELGHAGVTLQDGVYGTRFYPLTAFHGAHVILGAVWALLVIRKANRGDYSAKNYIGVEIFGLYWHFVDVVWVILFPLLYLI